MFLEEAIWIKDQLNKLLKKEANIFPILNVGSSTQEFRTIVSPHIHENIFKPLINKGKIIHTDLKEGEGIDISGDFTKNNTISKLKEFSIKSIICSNLLEHVIDINVIIDSLIDILEPDGYIVVTVPYRYPLHYDPIDTMYRPTPNELKSSFKNTSLIASKIVKSHRTYFGKLIRDPYILVLTFFRILLPFYKPKVWWHTVKMLPFLFSKLSTSCLILQKKS